MLHKQRKGVVMKVITMLVLSALLYSVPYVLADEERGDVEEVERADPWDAARSVAFALRNDGDHGAAGAAFAQLIVDYPDAPERVRAEAQYQVGRALREQRRFAEAEAAYGSVISDYPAARTSRRAQAQERVGHMLREQRRFAEAQAAYAKVLDDYPTVSGRHLANAQYLVGTMQVRQGLQEDAAASFVLAATQYGYQSLSWQKRILQAVNPAHLGREAFVDYLTTVLMIVPATEENAEFLGRVKSQLELLK